MFTLSPAIVRILRLPMPAALIVSFGLFGTAPQRARAQSASVAINAAFDVDTAATGGTATLVVTLSGSTGNHALNILLGDNTGSTGASTIGSVGGTCTTYATEAVGTTGFSVGVYYQGASCTVSATFSFPSVGVFPNAFMAAGLDDCASAPAEAQPCDAASIFATFAPITVVEGASAAFCDIVPDMAVSPQFIALTPGGEATVKVAMRNLCDESVTVPGDLLVSFSDGLTVVDATNGMIGLGQRAAVQTFSLNGGETRRWTVTVKAADSLAVAPLHITEYYAGGRVLSRIDGVFIVPEPVVEAPAVEPAPAVEAVPAAAAAPEVAPAPVTLPNTAGGLGSLLPQLLTALGMAGAGLALRRRG